MPHDETQPLLASREQISALGELSDDVMDLLRSVAARRRYAPGERIIEKGSVGDALFVLETGEAFATVPDAAGKPFDDPMAVGAVFGEMSLLTREVRSADVTAKTECTCAVLPFDALRDIISKHPKVAQLLTALVGRRLSKRSGIRRVGEYVIEGPMGRGGFSTVYRAHHAETGRRVALKMLKHELMWRADFEKRFRREAVIIQGLVHPHIVRVHGVVEAYATLFLAMEYVDGVDLGQLLASRGCLPPSEVRYVVRRLCAALHHAHEHGVIHRDVKPANVLLTAGGDVKLVDFGIAVGPGDGKRGKSFYGTPHYAAPEHVMKLPVDRRSDIYMLGITVYELLTGTVPYADDTVQTTLHKHVRHELPALPEFLPEDLRAFVATAARRRPVHRFDSCADAALALNPNARDESLRAARSGAWDATALRPTVDANAEVHEAETRRPGANRSYTERAREVDVSSLANGDGSSLANGAVSPDGDTVAADEEEPS